MDSDGETSKKTDSGTAFIMKFTDFAQVADWDSVLAFIKENEACDGAGEESKQES